MIRPLAYICSPIHFSDDQQTKLDMKKAGEYCRILYEAGYTPIAPQMFLPYYVDTGIAEERQELKQMSLNLLRRCHVFVICESEADCAMLELIQAAHDRHITATTLEGLLTARKLTSEKQSGAPEPHVDKT